MFNIIDKLADKVLSRIVPTVDAWAYKTGCKNNCDPYTCSEWECCRVGGGFMFQRSRPRVIGAARNCYLSFNGRC